MLNVSVEQHRTSLAARLACAWIAILQLSDTPADAQSRPESDQSPAAALQEAVHLLTDEAKQSLAKQQLARPAANFASDFRKTIPAQLVTQKIVRSMHRDPFIDAYIRWQLTSFNPTLPELNVHQFETLIQDLPQLISNPRADRELIHTLISAGKSGALSASTQESLNQQLNDLAARTSKTAVLNQAALGLRAWLQSQLPKTGERTLLAGLEQCAALVEGGWPVDDAKSKLEEQFIASDHDRKFNDDQRRSIINHLHPLIGKRNLYITSAVISNDRLSVEYADTAIYDFDVRRWTRSIVKE